MNTTDTDTKEMPRYECHKIVHALKIAILRRDDDGILVMYPVESGYEPIKLTPSYVENHAPQVGGYYVVYQDGYKSWSPAEAFEAGYTRIAA